MILNSTQYNIREDNNRRMALRELSVAASIGRFLELIQAGWFLVKPKPRPLPISLAKIIASKS